MTRSATNSTVICNLLLYPYQFLMYGILKKLILPLQKIHFYITALSPQPFLIITDQYFSAKLWDQLQKGYFNAKD